MQLAARTPANAAMSAASIDAMSGGGRFIAGLGASGPQIVEGWYGQPWGKPYYRVKDYVAIMRKIFKREEPVTHEGREISLPYKGEGSAGLAKPLKSILHMNPNIPIYLATGGETMVKLTAEIADGWLPMGFVLGAMAEYGPWLEEGFKRAGNGTSRRISPSRPPSMSRSTTTRERWRASSRRWRSMWAAWVTGPKTFTTTSWSVAASATPPGASRNCISRAIRTKPSPACPTSGSI
jgi:alkanesulfonate monooxygenase SsuD/methylene tetrahydromethanopterin reductase-like flavin-dependent oxidoreductase (luciferase family)